MNEQMITGPEGFRLITTFEGKPRLTARLCEGGRWEVGYGCTFHPPTPGLPMRPVQQGDTITPGQVESYLAYAVGEFEDVVRRHVTTPLNQYQFDAHVSLAYNIGEANYKTSSVVRWTNARRFEDAAKAFGLWTKATSSVDDNGNEWLSPDGQPCRYTRALRGLLRRHYAEACVSLGLDFEEACKDDAISLRAERLWEAEANRWHDRVLWDKTTPWSQVEDVARRYPLPPLGLQSAQGSTTVILDRVVAPVEKTAPEAPKAPPAPSPVGGPIIYKSPAAPPPTEASPVVKAAPPPAPAPEPVGTKKKSPNTVNPDDVPYKIDPNAGLKPLEETERAKGYWYQQAGIGMIRLGTLGAFGTGIQGVSATLQKDPVLSNLVLTGVVVGGMAVTGFVVKAYGDWRRKRGEKSATQGMF